MSTKFRDHVRGNVVGYVALFVALGGTAVAANQIGSGDIKKNAVKSKQIANGKKGVKSKDVRDDSLKGKDIDESTLGEVAGPPTGAAGGGLAGTFPDPSIGNRAIGPEAIDTIPAVRVTRAGSNQSIPDGFGTPTRVQFNAEGLDTANMHDNAVNNTRLTAPIDGLYLVTASIRWASNSSDTRRIIRIIKSPGANRAIHESDPQSGGSTLQNVEFLEDLEAGEYVEVGVNQDSGGPLDVSLAVGTGASMFWVGPLPEEG